MKQIRQSEYFKWNVITTLLCLVPIIIGVLFYSKLPDQVPVHFNANNQPNGYASRAFAVFCIPLLLAVLQVIICVIAELDPKRRNASKNMQILSRWIIPATSIFVHIVILVASLNQEFDLSMVVNLFIGFLFLIVGNLLPKCKYNYTIGIKLPTTLGSEENWNKTHRLAGFVWVIASLVIILFSFINATAYTWIPIVVMIAIPTVYSVVYAWKSKAQQ